MDSVRVTFLPEGTTTEAISGDTILSVASHLGIDINNLCGGEGVCGRCRVRVMKGQVKFSSKHLNFLDKKEIDEGYVLACQARLTSGETVIWIPPESRSPEDEAVITTEHIVNYDDPAPIEAAQESGNIPYFLPLSHKYYLELPHPTLEDNLSDLDRIYRELRKILPDSRVEAHFSCLWGLAALLRRANFKITVTIHHRDHERLIMRAVEPGNTTARNYGLAIDVGTTTIVAELVDLRTGTITGVEASHNRQASYGEDVISRMIFACGRGGLLPLTEAVNSTINMLTDALVEEAGITHNDITCVVASGNTVMTHLLLGLEPCHIRIDPYIPTATRFPQFQTAETGIKAHSKALLHCMPCVSSYVGGDITAGVLACGMNDRAEVSALIDVGTNGEIVIGNSEWLVCCSSSAGPAFEGAGIECGLRATRGAIEKVRIEGERVFSSTIGNQRPRGICGSGLIDVVAELVAERIIDQSGRFSNFDHPRVEVVEEVPRFVIADATQSETGKPVYVTEDDIGNLIKSKGAMLAAMKVLLENMGMGFHDLDRLHVAGGFGAHLDTEKAIFIGLLPDIPVSRIQFVGNSSLTGARLALLSTHAFHKAETIAKKMTYFELSVHPEFMNEFVAALFLPHTQMDLFPTVTKKLERRKKTA